MAQLPGASTPFVPFDHPVALPLPDVTDAPLVCIQINEIWMQYLIGCAEALTAQSTWNSDDENAVNVTVRRARNLIDILSGIEACPMIEFRVNPTDPHYWDYSTDSGAIWIRQPDTVSHWTPTFAVDGGAPGGYDISVNGDITSAPIPLLTAHQPDAVVTDPLTAIVNTIAPIAGVPGILIKALNDFALYLESNNISLHLTKASDRGTPDSTPVMQLDKPDSYAYPLLSIPD